MPAGRPVVWTPRRLNKVKKMLLAYIEANDIPILAEFAYKNFIRRAELYEHDEFKYTIDLLQRKKETALESGMYAGVVPYNAAALGLKQIGWSEKTETAITGAGGAPLAITINWGVDDNKPDP